MLCFLWACSVLTDATQTCKLPPCLSSNEQTQVHAAENETVSCGSLHCINQLLVGGPSGNARKTLPSSRYYISWVWLYYGHFITHDTRDIKVLVCSSHTRAPAWARVYVFYAQSWLAESKTNENSHYPQGVSPGVTALLLPALIGYALFHLCISPISASKNQISLDLFLLD